MKPPKTSPAPIEKLKHDLAELSAEATSTSLSSKRRKLLDAQLRELMADLGKLLHELDPIRQPAAVFDPSNPKIVGRFIALALMAQPRMPLKDVQPFYGSGVYSIYYKGRFSSYSSLRDSETPIYVGQAAPALSNARTAMEQGDRLARRLRDHRSNIAKAITTLDIEDFEYRALVVQSRLGDCGGRFSYPHVSNRSGTQRQASSMALGSMATALKPVGTSDHLGIHYIQVVCGQLQRPRMRVLRVKLSRI